MIIERLQPDSAPLPAAASQPAAPSSSAQTPQPEKQKAAEAAAADQVIFSEQEDAKLGGIRVQNERQNLAASAIRETDRAARELSQKIDQLKQPLEAIVKNFPPFAQQDQERVKLLMSYTAIRKEIDQLTVPPPPSVIEARRQLPLPRPLNPDADDSQIADHVDKLDAAAQSLQALRGDLAADTALFLGDGRFASIFSSAKGAESQASEPVATEFTAARKSAEIGQQFAESVSQGVTLQRPQFLKGMS